MHPTQARSLEPGIYLYITFRLYHLVRAPAPFQGTLFPHPPSPERKGDEGGRINGTTLVVCRHERVKSKGRLGKESVFSLILPKTYTNHPLMKSIKKKVVFDGPQDLKEHEE